MCVRVFVCWWDTFDRPRIKRNNIHTHTLTRTRWNLESVGRAFNRTRPTRNFWHTRYLVPTYMTVHFSIVWCNSLRFERNWRDIEKKIEMAREPGGKEWNGVPKDIHNIHMWNHADAESVNCLRGWFSKTSPYMSYWCCCCGYRCGCCSCIARKMHLSFRQRL